MNRPLRSLARAVAARPAARSALVAAAGSRHRALRGHLVRRRAVRRYLGRAGPPRLHLGCGPFRLAGWLNADLVAGEVHVDLRRRLPFQDGAFEYVFAEHVVEHLSEPAGHRLLGEARRVLRPGGVLRLTTPDLAKLIAIYQDSSPVVRRDDFASYLSGVTGRPIACAAQVLNAEFRLWGHRHIYDEDQLSAALRDAGFSRVERRSPGSSPHALLDGVERHGGAPWVNQAESMSLEAYR